MSNPTSATITCAANRPIPGTSSKRSQTGRPDPFREEVWTTSAFFEANNLNKRGIAVDLKTSAGQTAIRPLLAHADVLIENFSLGVTNRLGIDFPAIRALNPDIVYLSLSSQGQTGPESEYRSYGSTLDLLSGLASITGYDSEHPRWSSPRVNYPDQIVSILGAGLVLHCLLTGRRGVQLDVSQRELASWMVAGELLGAMGTGITAVPSGNKRSGSVPHDCYPCDGGRWVALLCHNEEEREGLACLVDEKFRGRNKEWWHKHIETIDLKIAGWTRLQERDDVVRRLGERGVPCVPALTASERAEMACFIDRQVFISTPAGRSTKGYPLQLHSYRPSVPTRAPTVGRDNEGVFSSLRVDAWPVLT
ncbi:MAG: CoA transferase [Nitrososphaerales archaeon]